MGSHPNPGAWIGNEDSFSVAILPNGDMFYVPVFDLLEAEEYIGLNYPIAITGANFIVQAIISPGLPFYPHFTMEVYCGN